MEPLIQVQLVNFNANFTPTSTSAFPTCKRIIFFFSSSLQSAPLLNYPKANVRSVHRATCCAESHTHSHASRRVINVVIRWGSKQSPHSVNTCSVIIYHKGVTVSWCSSDSLFHQYVLKTHLISCISGKHSCQITHKNSSVTLCWASVSIQSLIPDHHLYCLRTV